MPSDLRRLTVPDIRPPGDIWQDVVWDVFGETYPTECAGSVDITTHEDPFAGAGQARECYHAFLSIYGLGRIDLGWAIRGEAYPDPPVVTTWLDQFYVETLRDGFGSRPVHLLPQGSGQQNTSWAAMLVMLRTTLLGLGVRLVQGYRDHPAVRGFREAAALAEYSHNGMLRRWPRLGGFDLELLVTVP